MLDNQANTAVTTTAVFLKATRVHTDFVMVEFVLEFSVNEMFILH